MKKFVIAVILLAAMIAPSFSAGYDDLNAAISYFNQSRKDDAIVWFTRAIQDGDLLPDQKRIAYLDRGLTYAANNDANNALADYTAAIAAKPDDLLAYRERAAVYVALGDFEKAKADYAALLKLQPRDYSTRMIYGWMSWQLGQFQSAGEAFYYFSNTKTEAWLWLQLANVQLGKPVDDFKGNASMIYATSAREFARSWPVPMARFFKGEISEADALSAAPDRDVCSANIYLGLWHLVHKEQQQARGSLDAAEAECGKSGEYWRIAHAELAKMKGEAPK